MKSGTSFPSWTSAVHDPLEAGLPHRWGVDTKRRRQTWDKSRELKCGVDFIRSMGDGQTRQGVRWHAMSLAKSPAHAVKVRPSRRGESNLEPWICKYCYSKHLHASSRRAWRPAWRCFAATSVSSTSSRHGPGPPASCKRFILDAVDERGAQ